ncbi:MAG: protein kinase family protein, partial [Endozoicomonadaceae bacterium]|nr:protein kinase family protein [Endozoicomonadaceae bacterium]
SLFIKKIQLIKPVQNFSGDIRFETPEPGTKREATQIFIKQYIQDIRYLINNNIYTTEDLMETTEHIGSIDQGHMEQLETLHEYMTFFLYDTTNLSSVVFLDINQNFKNYLENIVIKKIILHDRYGKNADLCSLNQELLFEIKHENIVELLGSYTIKNDVDVFERFLIFKRYASDSFNFFNDLEFSKIRFKTTLLLFLHIMRAMEYLTSQKIVHSDIKLENILCNADATQWCLTDFEGAKKITSKHDRMQFKASGEILGTKGYIAPEVKSKKIFSHYSDIYSFGATMFYLFTLKPYQSNVLLNYQHAHYNTLFFKINKEAKKLYTPCVLALRRSVVIPIEIINQFKDNPIQVAKVLSQKFLSEVFPRYNNVLEYSRTHEYAQYIFMPAMLTAVQLLARDRGKHDQFIQYFECLLEQIE